VSFDPFTTPISFAKVKGVKTPGICVIEDADQSIAWDERAGPFLAGAFLVGGGRKLVHFSMRLTLLTSQDFADWYAFKPIVDRPPYGTRPKSLDIWHPWLVDQGVRSAVVEKLGQPKLSSDGSFEIKIDWIEFRIPKITLAKPEASSTPTSNDPVDKLIENLSSQVQKLSG